MKSENRAIDAVLGNDDAILDPWLTEAGAIEPGARRAVRPEAAELLKLLLEAVASGADIDHLDGPAWAPLRSSLDALSRSRAARGQTAGDTSVFVLALKKPLFELLQAQHATDLAALSSS